MEALVACVEDKLTEKSVLGDDLRYLQCANLLQDAFKAVPHYFYLLEMVLKGLLMLMSMTFM